ncbi:hypothetical protein Sjap_016099 [Stephania japonica]|uniref:Phosphoglucan phosphatase LSF1, chloroplastic n=1 Tax=Stephania japonica TaxID=461633 RepID=A0AAP0IMC6_9MAGN
MNAPRQFFISGPSTAGPRSQCLANFAARPPNSSFWGRTSQLGSGRGEGTRVSRWRVGIGKGRVLAMYSANSSFRMNLYEYMVTLERPLGIRFGVSVDGRVFIYALKKGGNAEKSRIIMVGDVLKKASNGSGGGFIEMKNFMDTKKMLKQTSGSVSLILERPSSPFPIQQLCLTSDLDNLFNKGRVPIATWSRNILAADLQPSSEGSGNSGFAVFSPKFLSPPGWKHLSGLDGSISSQKQNAALGSSPNQLVSILSEKEFEVDDWGHGSFPLEEYIKALDRSKGELIYNHSLGMQYSKITEQIYIGSCIQTEKDVETLAKVGITAVLNFQSANECSNWGIDSDSINDCCQHSNILMVNYPIREADPFDLRKKLPFSAGLLLRLLRKKLRVYVTCTTGLDRSPACVISYLHWMQDTSIHDAFNFMVGLHPCRPNRAAIVWATWDLVTMLENNRHDDGPPTHAVTFIWNGREGEEVFLVGDFTGNWKEPLRAIHKGGSKYEADVKLPMGKYRYKFIINGQWRHSTVSPTETDESGNINNVIILGSKASVRPSFQPQPKDSAVVKVIERPLTEYERVMLAKAARCIAFSICPIRLAPK